uniref:ADP-ribosylation factor-like protein 6-interacting protein 4 n=1 Tax=Timema bartmani TaxID=61472 RepID=A0A7R9HZV9_9NEOP|nr:unnamed protein product [Timema bartmani]
MGKVTRSQRSHSSSPESSQVTKKRESSSDEESKPLKKKLRVEPAEEKKTKLGTHDDSEDSTESVNRETHKKHKKSKKKKNKKDKKHKKKSKKEKKAGSESSVTKDAGSSEDRLLLDRAKSMAPMTKEEWDKRQNVVRRVVDKETGRSRLIKGDGEVLEEIVSKKQHREINRLATKGDGEFFQKIITSSKK